MTKNSSSSGSVFDKFSLGNVKLSKQVALGFTLVLFLLAGVAYFAFSGLSGANGNFNQYRSYALQTNQMGRIQANLLSARLAAKDFLLKNTVDSAEQVRTRLDFVEELIVESETMFSRQSAIDLVKGHFNLIELYKSSFETVTERAKERNALVEILNSVGPQAEKDLTAIMKSAFEDDDAKASFAAGSALRSLLLARLYTNRFLTDNLESSAERANAELAQFVQLAQTMLTELQNPKRRELANSVLGLAGQYQETFVNVVDVINARNKIVTETLDVIGPQMADEMEGLKLENKALQDELGPRATAEVAQSVNLTLGISIAAFIIGAALAFIIGKLITGPILRLTGTMSKLASGELDVDIAGTNTKNEIGSMAKAVEVFKDNAIRVKALNEQEEQAEAARKQQHKEMMEELRRSFGYVVDAAVAGDFSRRVSADFPDEELNELASSVNNLVSTVETGLGETGKVLGALSNTDLTARVTGNYQGAFLSLKEDTNQVADKLTEIIGQLRETSSTLKLATSDILSGANDLADRTTKQAAMIEETSAAMEQLSSNVSSNTEQAQVGASKANEVRAAAEESGHAMSEANSAMESITSSSAKISNIIGMIDDIAFQTNLLALNASVEAARAGEAGKGFAVVAVEVRRLAQSAAEASSEVKQLVEQSASEVANGTKLVSLAAEHLEKMLGGVNENASLMNSIAANSREQASGIDEITTAVRQMDEMTQHNAALVEETNAAIEQTETQATELDTIVSVFKISKLNNPASTHNAAEPAPKRVPEVVNESHETTPKVAVGQDWAEF